MESGGSSGSRETGVLSEAFDQSQRQRTPVYSEITKLLDDFLEETEISTAPQLFSEDIYGWTKKHHFDC